ncbi:Xanthotoxin 5-hydroxylase CYP82C4-like protein [Drosera capensis]
MPAFVIRIGLSRWLIVNEWKAVKECFTTNDKVFASRPASTTATVNFCFFFFFEKCIRPIRSRDFLDIRIHVGHNQAIFAFSPYGSYWRDTRKFMVNELLSNSKLQSNRQLRLSEIDHFIKDIYAFIKGTNGLGGGITKPVPIVEWSNRLMLNMITMMVARKRYGYMKTGDEAHQILKAMGELMNGAGLLALPDAFPFALVQWLDPQGNIRMLKRISSQLGEILGCWINEHQLRRAGDQYVHDEDFIDLLISAVEQGKLKSDQHANEIIIQAMIETVIIGGSNTTSVTLVWLLSLLLNNEHAMKRAKEEIDQVVGKTRQVEERDLRSLVYLEAVVKETLRLYPPIPLLVPHLLTASCTIGGCLIPKNTRMLVNIWKIQRDPQVWKDPNHFRPERFLTNGDAAFFEAFGQNFRFLPFGSGRRSCPGAKLALEALLYTAAQLLHSFDMSTPSPVDMAEGPGNNIPQAVPLQLVLTPCLPQALYVC